jgi:hypothetical protein
MPSPVDDDDQAYDTISAILRTRLSPDLLGRLCPFADLAEPQIGGKTQ